MQKNLKKRDRLKDFETEFMATKGEKWGKGRVKLGFGIDIYTLLYIKQVGNKDLSYSTVSSIQYCVVTYMEK